MKSPVGQMTEMSGYLSQDLAINSESHFRYYCSVDENLTFAQVCSLGLSVFEP